MSSTETPARRSSGAAASLKARERFEFRSLTFHAGSAREAIAPTESQSSLGLFRSRRADSRARAVSMASPRRERKVCSAAAKAAARSATLAPLLLPQTAGDSAGRLPVACLPTPQQANGHDCGVYVIAIAAIVAGAPSEASGQPLSEAVSAAVSALTPAAITAQRREYHAHLTRALDGGGGQ
mmetsp:Transcript_41334/g.136981  ORF Transcript_41334/g.136981 Transcript_41334/m.136981 type:complete len:182 (+) Transcript_41334:257-802(+)